jgi:hypothetical protein
MTIKTDMEIQSLDTNDLVKYYGELKAEEARAETRFKAACRNVAVGGITAYHQQLLDRIGFIEQQLNQPVNAD